MTQQRELYPYQEQALTRLTRHKAGGALFMEPGLGKTLVAIRALGDRTALVLCPLVAVGVWEQELATEGIRSMTPTGSGKQKAEQIAKPSGEQVVILNYEALLNPAVMRELTKHDFEVLIMDEAQRIKNPRAKRSKAAMKLAQGRTTWILTGTPVAKNLLDLWSYFHSINPEIWDKASFTRFRQVYAIMGGFEGREVIGFRGVDDLKARIRPYTYALRKDQALDLPPRRAYAVPVKLDGKAWRDYRTLATTGVLGEWETSNSLELALRLSQLASQLKLPATLDLGREVLDSGQKLLVFYRFREPGSVLADTFRDEGYQVYEINGDTTGAGRTNAVKNFQAHAGPAVMLAQISAGSVAVTLTAASEAIYHDLSWSYEDFVQSRDRIYRIGQTADKVRYQYVTVVGPNGGKLIDGRILEAIEMKSDFSAMVMKDPTWILPKDGV